jgi:hypothetical protein
LQALKLEQQLVAKQLPQVVPSDVHPELPLDEPPMIPLAEPFVPPLAVPLPLPPPVPTAVNSHVLPLVTQLPETSPFDSVPWHEGPLFALNRSVDPDTVPVKFRPPLQVIESEQPFCVAVQLVVAQVPDRVYEPAAFLQFALDDEQAPAAMTSAIAMAPVACIAAAFPLRSHMFPPKGFLS